MKMKKLMAILASAVLTTSLVLTGCGSQASSNNSAQTSSKPAQKTQLTFWAPFSGPDGPFMKKIIDTYNQSQNEVEVKFVIVPQNQYYNTVDLAFSGKQALPNVMIMHVDQIPTYQSKGLLSDITETAKNAGVKSEDFATAAWKATDIDGKHYGIPLDIHPLILYYNKDLFKAAGLDPEKPPKTREEFLQYAQKLTDTSKGQWGYVVPTLWPQQFIFPTLVYQNGGDLINASSKKIDYNSPEAIEALQFEHDLIYKYKVSPENVQQDGEVTMFVQGKSAMQFNGPWQMGAWDQAKINYGAAPVPQLGSKELTVFANSHQFVIPEGVNKGDQLKAVEKFMKYISENTYQWALSGQAPASEKVRQSEDFKKLTTQQPKVAEEFPYAKFNPTVPKFGQLTTPLWTEINNALLNKKSIEQALNDATTAAQKILNEQ